MTSCSSVHLVSSSFVFADGAPDAADADDGALGDVALRRADADDDDAAALVAVLAAAGAAFAALAGLLALSALGVGATVVPADVTFCPFLRASGSYCPSPL
jgi:hypothetical protein